MSRNSHNQSGWYTRYGVHMGDLGRVNGMHHDSAVNVLFYRNSQYRSVVIDTDDVVKVEEADIIAGKLPEWVDGQKVFLQYPKVKAGRE